MLEFLKNIGINDRTILKMINENSEAVIQDLECNSDNAVDIINYLKELNIKVIDELLVDRIDLFLKTKREIMKLFSKFNIAGLVKEINDDYFNIYYIFEEND